MDHDVFISYSEHDKAVADAACATLEQRGIRCWIAPRDVPVGHSWAAALVEAIGESDVFVLILSNGSNASPQVTREVGEAVDNALPIIPLRIEAVEPSDDMRYYIKSIHWLDAMSPPLERHLDELAKLVGQALESETRADGADPRSRPPADAFRDAPPEAPRNRNRMLWTAGALAIVALVVAITLVLGGGDATNDREQEATASAEAAPSTSDADPAPDQETAAATSEESFEGELDAGWVWLGETGESVSLSNGSLEIVVGESPNTRLVRQAPTRPYEVVTKVEFTPTSNFQFAGLIVQNDGGDDWLQVGRAFCDPTVEGCVGDGVYADNIQNDQIFGLSDLQPLDPGGDLYLRLTVDGSRYAAAFSFDPSFDDWYPIGSYDRDFASPMVGVIAHQAREEPIVAQFDFVTITELG